MAPFYLFLIFWVICAFLCAHLAKQRNRNPFIWFTAGLLFTLFAFLLLFFLPAKTPKKEVEVTSNFRAVQQSTANSLYPEDNIPPPLKPLSKRIPTGQSIPWYFIDKKLEKVGPLKLAELRKAFVENKIDENSYIWCEEFDNWTQLVDFQNRSLITDPDFI